MEKPLVHQNPRKIRVIKELVEGKGFATELQTLLQQPIADHGYSVSADELVLKIWSSFSEASTELNTWGFAFQIEEVDQADSDDRKSKDSTSELKKKNKQGGKDRRGCYKRRKMATSAEQQNGSVGTTAATTNASSSHTTPAPAMAPAEKPGKFFGVDFKHWQQKMFFYLTTLSLQRFISKDIPVLGEETPENERFVVTEAWKHSDFLCKNYILSCLEDSLYNVYSIMKTSRELWNALEKKYKTEDAGLKKFVAAKFLYFKMVDGKSVITQVHELQVIVHDLLAEDIKRVNIFIQDIDYCTSYKFMIEGMVINEAFQVAAFIEKLPPLWKDFKNYLKHKRKEMTLEDLIVRLRIEEDNKAAEKKSHGNSTIMGANIVEEASTSKKRKKPYGPKNYPSKKRFKGNCHNCGHVGHKATECRAPKKDKKKSQANMIEKNDEIDDLCAMLSECNLVGNPREWWIDSGATRHVCANKELFTSYAPAGPNGTVFMVNSATAKIEGTDKIALKMTSRKIVTLKDVLHVPEMRKNLVSTSLLVKNDFKCVFVSDKVVVSKNEMYVGKGYLTEGLFKLNVIAIDMNKISASSYSFLLVLLHSFISEPSGFPVRLSAVAAYTVHRSISVLSLPFLNPNSQLEAEGQGIRALPFPWTCNASAGSSSFVVHPSQPNHMECEPDPVFQIGATKHILVGVDITPVQYFVSSSSCESEGNFNVECVIFRTAIPAAGALLQNPDNTPGLVLANAGSQDAKQVSETSHADQEADVHMIIRGADVPRGRVFKRARTPSTEEGSARECPCEEILVFSEEDLEATMEPHNDALVISFLSNNTRIKRVLVDPGSSVNIIRSEVVGQLGLLNQVIPTSRVLHGFNMVGEETKGEIIISIGMSGTTHNTEFQVINGDMKYNALLGRPWIHNIRAVPSTLHQVIRFPTRGGITTIYGERQVRREIFVVHHETTIPAYPALDGEGSAQTLEDDEEDFFTPRTFVAREESDATKSTVEVLEKTVLIKHLPDRKVYLGTGLTPELRAEFIQFLSNNIDCFAWSHLDMTGIPP
ncbi:PREDICTED: uncharacterized protein LOC109212591 [Nicotiana attenuata]|uniref:uncharacterized protein LOC109212591 n=1 Tax=Nicotiana attenuata TaxID=49451 RepID=UPI0009058C72|nr:PREDICTED: uncharacterized protein LOC109212591 [Nicotiana attenuata]